VVQAVAPNAIGCTICWSVPLAGKTTMSMTSAVPVPFAPSDDDREGAGHERADERM
jgi:hypothetical protein